MNDVMGIVYTSKDDLSMRERDILRMMLDNRLQLIREARNGGHCAGEEHWAELQRTIDTLEKK